MSLIITTRAGRIALHLIAMLADREVTWHWSGIKRELR